jgi:hypothetical protein
MCMEKLGVGWKVFGALYVHVLVANQCEIDVAKIKALLRLNWNPHAFHCIIKLVTPLGISLVPAKTRPPCLKFNDFLSAHLLSWSR